MDSRPDGWPEIAEALAIEQKVGRLPTTVFESPHMFRVPSCSSETIPRARNRSSRSCSQRLQSASTT
jgi:hypothetical protein